MFDPTIFDNLKIVFEGKLYDLDSEGVLLVTGREDRIDLASFSRTFLMCMERPGGDCSIQLRISSGLPDFAGELRGLWLADESPGARLQLFFELPGTHVARAHDFHQRLSALWGHTVDITHKRTMIVEHAPSSTDPTEESYRIELTFIHKIDESHIEDVDSLIEHLLETVNVLES